MKRKNSPPPVLVAAEYLVLETVRAMGPGECRDISFCLDRDRAWVRKFAARLVAKGFLSLKGRVYSITASGRAAAKTFAHERETRRRHYEAVNKRHARNGKLQPA